MKVTVDLDEATLALAEKLTGIPDASSLVNRALEVLVAQCRNRRLMELGGAEPH